MADNSDASPLYFHLSSGVCFFHSSFSGEGKEANKEYLMLFISIPIISYAWKQHHVTWQWMHPRANGPLGLTILLQIAFHICRNQQRSSVDIRDWCWPWRNICYHEKHMNFWGLTQASDNWLAIWLVLSLSLGRGEGGAWVRHIQLFWKVQQHISFLTLFSSATRYFLGNSITKLAVAVATMHWNLFSFCYLDTRVPRACSLRQIPILKVLPCQK